MNMSFHRYPWICFASYCWYRKIEWMPVALLYLPFGSSSFLQVYRQRFQLHEACADLKPTPMISIQFPLTEASYLLIRPSWWVAWSLSRSTSVVTYLPIRPTKGWWIWWSLSVPISGVIFCPKQTPQGAQESHDLQQVCIVHICPSAIISHPAHQHALILKKRTR